MNELTWMRAPARSGAYPYEAAPRTPTGSDDESPSQSQEPRRTSSVPLQVPEAGEVPAPSGEPTLEGADPAALTAILGSYVRQVYGDLRQAHREAFDALNEAPQAAAAAAAAIAVTAAAAAAERPFALAALEQQVGALAAYAAGDLSALIARAAGDRVGGEARAALMKALSAATGAAAPPVARPGRAARPRAQGRAAASASPAARTLLAELESRLEEVLREQEGRVERRLLAAGAAMRKAEPAALRALAEALARKVESSSLRVEHVHRICTGWLQLCSAISLGPRSPGEPVMPAANRVGGGPLADWRRAYPGFLEIDIDFPDEVDGLRGAAIGKLTLAGGPGAARILRQSGRALGELAVYRRLWLGTHRVDRAPDVVIAPDHELEVNASSSLLAALGMETRGRLRDLAAQGPGEEHERARLLARRAREGDAQLPEQGPLGPLMGAHPPRSAEERAAMDAERLSVLDLRRQVRAVAAFDGASELWAWVGSTSSDGIS
jgi:hypothetical protein